MRNPGGERGVSAGKCNFSGRFHRFWQALGRGAKAAGLAGVENEGRRGRPEAAPHRASDAPERRPPAGAQQGAGNGVAGVLEGVKTGPAWRSAEHSDGEDSSAARTVLAWSIIAA